MKTNNLNNIFANGFTFDEKLLIEKDDRICQAIFSIFNNKSIQLTNNFNLLYELLLSEKDSGIVYQIDNENHISNGSMHFTFLQQLSFASFYYMTNDELEKHYKILKEILVLPFTIKFNRLIAVPIGLVLCGEADIDINELRNKYRKACKDNGLSIIEPYFNNIIHSTIFRFTSPVNVKEILDKFNYFLNNAIDYGCVTINHFYMGKGTIKLNRNEILIDYIIKNDSTDDG